MADRDVTDSSAKFIRRHSGRCQVKGRIEIISYRRIKGGPKYGTPQTYLLTSVMIGGVFYDHLWVRIDHNIRKLGANIGDIISFTAKISVYNVHLGFNGKVGVKQPYDHINIHRVPNLYDQLLSAIN